MRSPIRIRPAPTLPPPALAARRAAPISAARRAAEVPPTPSSSPGIGAVWQWGALLLLVAGMSYYLGRDRQPLALAGASGPASNHLTSGTNLPAATAPVSATQRVVLSNIDPRAAGSAGAAAVASRYDQEVAGRYDQAQDAYIYDTGAPLKLTLRNGTTLRVGAASTENRLYTFLATPALEVDPVNRTKGWINFDRVNFEPAKATLTPGSARQLRNIAAILKSFPAAVVKIGGYTDSTGAPLHNFQLSEERAKAALLTLASLGVNVNHLQAKGYGAKYFVASNTTPTGRSLNRRISVRVIQK